ncbi:probable MAPKK kinase Kpp4 [Melanopsichium pennsylvanicum]|uniref:mitogen-activated protein kinase kinase kinase n=2 Tax=Melanopsichium pennsylvanicum TaxID=63383 RepID=A0AAJ5C6S6_9BASI|nr:probable MAPKK kinase Kpp4 [Melanopsichium pennsylvanicum]
MGTGAMQSQFVGPSSNAGSPRSRPTTPLSAGFIQSATTYDDLARWQDTDVAAWLNTNRLAHHASTFAENDIRGSILLDVDQAALKHMGITMVKDRVRIHAAIKLLNKRCADAAIARRPSVASLPPLSPLASHPLYANEGEIEYLQHDHISDSSSELSFGINSMGMRRGQMRPPPLTLKQSTSRGMPAHASPANSLNNNQRFAPSAARGLTSGAARGSVWNTSSSASAKPGTADGGALQRKLNAIGSTAAPAIVGASSSLSSSRHPLGHNIQNGRPSTATGASGYSSATASHPSRSALISSSPTAASFGSAISANSGRPSTATGAQTYSTSMAGAASSSRDAYSPLTPISESNSHGTTPTTPSAVQQQQQAGYAVGRGPFAASQRYAAASSTSSQQQSSSGGAIRRIDSGEGYSQLAGYQNPNPPTLEDLKRRTIKFISEEDNTTRIVNVSDCRDAYDVMARVLKKFGKPPSGNSYTPTADQGPTGDELGAVETWGIFATSADGQNTKALSDNELLAICHAPQPHDPLRERGLTLRRIPNHLPGEDARKVPVRSGRNRLEAFFGERMPVAQMQPAGPGSGTNDEGDAGSVTISGKKMKRASTVSIMSGLGVGPFSSSSSHNNSNHGSDSHRDSHKAEGKHASSKKESKHLSPTAITSKPSKIRNFFGQRPPSELINTNLADFFPSTDSKALQRTARRSIYGRASASTRSKRNSTWSFVADPDAPPLPNKESLDGHMSSQTPLDRSSASTREHRGTTPVIQIGYDSRSEDDHSSHAHNRLSASPSHLQQPLTGPPTLPPVVGRDSLDEWSRDLKAVGSPVSEFSSTFQSSKHGSGSSQQHHQGMQHSIGHPSRPSISRRASGESARSRRSLASQVRHGLSAARERNADAASLLTVDEITQEVENRRESISLAGAGGGWVVDEDGVPIPIPGAAYSARSSSAAASTSPSSRVSSSYIHSSHVGHIGHEADSDSDEEANQSSDLEGPPRTTRARTIASKAPSIHAAAPDSAVLQAPGDESDRHLGDPMAVTRSTTSTASSVSELRRSIDDHAAYSTGSGSEYTDSDASSSGSETDDDDEQGSDVYLPSANKPPIKWHKGALIGAGSFGNVFLGMNAKTGLLMAVKQVELPSGDSHLDQRKKGMLDALEREIKLLKTLEHENIVQYLDSFADGSHLNIFLEYVPGGSIVALLRNYGAFEEPLVRNFVRQIVKGLSFLHNRGIMHRDIKGANILVDNKGGIKISDFGISKKVESDLVLATNKGAQGGAAGGQRPSLQGSVFWMAPEVVKQTSYTIKADIWSLGCLVVEMISGTHPWAELNQMQALFQIGMGRKPSLPDEISNECRNFLEKTFELDYNNRPSADELLNHAFMGSEMTFPTPPAGPAGGTGGGGGGGEENEDVGHVTNGGEEGGGEVLNMTVDTTADTETNATSGRETKEGKRPTRSKSTRRLEREKRHKEAAAAAAAAAQATTAADLGTPNTPTSNVAPSVGEGFAASTTDVHDVSPTTSKVASATGTGGMVESFSTSSIATARGHSNTNDTVDSSMDEGVDIRP